MRSEYVTALVAPCRWVGVRGAGSGLRGALGPVGVHLAVLAGVAAGSLLSFLFWWWWWWFGWLGSDRRQVLGVAPGVDPGEDGFDVASVEGSARRVGPDGGEREVGPAGDHGVGHRGQPGGTAGGFAGGGVGAGAGWWSRHRLPWYFLTISVDVACGPRYLTYTGLLCITQHEVWRLR